MANSFGSIVALNAAIRRPEVFATPVAHEPPLLGMLGEAQFEPVRQEVNRCVGHVIELLDAGYGEAGRRCSSKRSFGGLGHRKRNSPLNCARCSLGMLRPSWTRRATRIRNDSISINCGGSTGRRS